MSKKIEIQLAHDIRIVECTEGHCHVELLNEDGEVFAEAVLDMEEALDVGLDMVEMAEGECAEGVPDGATVQ